MRVINLHILCICVNFIMFPVIGFDGSARAHDDIARVSIRVGLRSASSCEGKQSMHIRIYVIRNLVLDPSLASQPYFSAYAHVRAKVTSRPRSAISRSAH